MNNSIIKISIFLIVLNCSQNNKIDYTINVTQECKIKVTSTFFNTIPCQSILFMPFLCKHKVSVHGNYYSKSQDVDKCYVSAFSYTIKNKPITKEERDKLLSLGWYEAHDLRNKITFIYSLQTTLTKPRFYIEGKPPEFNFEHDLPITEPWLTAVEFNIESMKELTYVGYSK